MNNDELKKLMSGIAVVIDDSLEKNGTAKSDKIGKIVEKIKDQEIPLYIENEIPSDLTCNNLLRSASFVLLDWKLWSDDSSELESKGIQDNIDFLIRAKSHFIPVFIFTNEDPEDIKDEICPHGLYDKEHVGKNFIFIERKSDLTEGEGDLFGLINNWINKNASVYTLKAWEQAFYEAKRNLFSSMYEKSPSWPKVFWSSYKKDGADPSSSMVNLINNNILARMETDIFADRVLSKRPYAIGSEDIKSVLEGASFIKDLPDSDIRSGDLFKCEKEYLINIRADCDCLPRGKNKTVDSIELFCLKGKPLGNNKVKDLYNMGHFNERVWQSIVFGVNGGETIEFDHRNLIKKPFSELKNKRVGRLIHPYITRIQQRYAFFLQRQGLPRIPEEAIDMDTKK